MGMIFNIQIFTLTMKMASGGGGDALVREDIRLCIQCNIMYKQHRPLHSATANVSAYTQRYLLALT